MDEKALPKLNITSEDEFNSLMEEVDAALIADNVPIVARPIRAGLEITKRYNIVLNAVPDKIPIEPGVFTPEQISVRIHDWMEKRYGERLKMSCDVGRTVIPLRGSIYVINCPLIMGSVRFVCEPQTFGEKRESIGIRKVPTCNALDLIDGFTTELALSLTAEEVVKIGLAHSTAMAAYVSLDAVKDVKLVTEAIGDLLAAVNHLIDPRQQTGLSKWASLQAAEKLFKAYIATKGEAFKQTHDLSKLASHAERLGMTATPQRYIDDLQCAASVRYGAPPVALQEAMLAHHISLEICDVAAKSIGLSKGRSMPSTPTPIIDGMPADQFLEKYATPP